MASVQEVAGPSFTGWKAAKDTLKNIRERGDRESREVTYLGKILVTQYASKLGDEGDLRTFGFH